MSFKPSSKEEEYMFQQELERRRRVARETAARQEEGERQRQKEAHWMHCPKCGSMLQEIEYRGVRIDQCPACQGIFLDAGELDQVAQKEPGGIFGALGRLLR